MKLARAAIQLEADPPDWLADALAAIEAGRAVRKEFEGGGRLHIDRALPFLCVHFTRSDEAPVAREVVRANASHLLAPGAATAKPIVAAVGKLLERRFGAFMVLEMDELAQDELLTDNAPLLPPFKVEVMAGAEGNIRAAAMAFVDAVEAIPAKFRTPRVELHEWPQESALEGETLDLPFPSMRVRFAPVYRQHNSGRIFPEVRERLIASIFDATLHAFAAFARSTRSLEFPTHRALGRKAFIDAVERTDRSIDDVASSFDFLLAVTPINAEAAWSEFAASDFARAPLFLYRPLIIEIEAAKKTLFSIPFDHLEDPVLYQLYREKQQEVDLQLTMLSARETRKFIEFGRALYGPVEPNLLSAAEEILARSQKVAADPQAPAERRADSHFVEMRAGEMIAAYAQRYGGFEALVEVRDDLPAGLLVSGRRLLIARSTIMEPDRVGPILSHEIGVHLLTYFNGSAQGLRLFRSGLAGYEGMQEGLAVFAEYLSGGNDERAAASPRRPRARLRRDDRWRVLAGGLPPARPRTRIPEGGRLQCCSARLSRRRSRQGRDLPAGTSAAARSSRSRGRARALLDGQDSRLPFCRHAGTACPRPARRPFGSTHVSGWSGSAVAACQGARADGSTRYAAVIGAAHMRIAFFVNSVEGEAPYYTTTWLALAALARGHEVCYVTPGDFVLRPDDSLLIRATTLKGTKPKKPETLLTALKGEQAKISTLDLHEVQVLFLRNDPSEDADTRPWAVYVGTNFGRLAAARGVLVVNDPDGLSLAQNKLYFQEFPEIIRPTSLISRSIEEIRSFIEDHPGGAILKPLQGSGGKNVFKINSKDEANLNQIFEVASGGGYLIAQNYIPDAVAGDIRLFLLNGRPLERDGVYAAFRRVPAEGDVRSNMHVSGTPEAATVTPEILEIAERLRPKLIEDGMFLVGLDIVGDKVLEANVFTPGGLPEIAALHGVDFSEDIMIALENKVRIQELYRGAIPNRTLAVL